MKHRFGRLFVVACITLVAAHSFAEPATPLTALARMPVKEVTVFKDGHAFVQHAGKMLTDGQRNVVHTALAQPAHAATCTFSPSSADKAVKLSTVTASARKVKLERTALNMRELIEANVGA